MSFAVKDLPRMDYQIQNPVTQPANSYQIPNVGNVLQGSVTHLQVQGQDDPQRWTQYQHLWRQHVYNNMNGMVYLFRILVDDDYDC